MDAGCRYTSLFVNNDSKLLVFDKSSDLFLASPGSEFYNVDGPIDKSGRHVMDFEEFKAKLGDGIFSLQIELGELNI